MSKRLVIVESPTKAKTIGKFLGKDFEVLASYGHVRDLPNSASEIPAAIKKEKWSRLGVNVEKDFEPLYIIPSDKEKRVKELRHALKDASEVLLATDEDREGESISWHLLEVLKPKVPVKRLVFHEITREAINHSLSHARDIDDNLVRAQETRRIVDRLYGYTVSPLLWKKMGPGLSAGRVQSVAMKLLVERERDRINFRKAAYWDLKGEFSKQTEGTSFETELTHVDGKRVATGKDFDPATGNLKSEGNVALLLETEARALQERLAREKAKVSGVEKKPFTTRPSPPFTTSTLQQEASRKLGYSARRTMQVAQSLYENGFITYMRTDSTNLSQEAIHGARRYIESEFGKDYVHPEPREYKTKVKNAQEAHEAIRPAGSEFVYPSLVRDKLGIDAFRLYDLIWKRMVACQMKDARGTRISATFEVGNAVFRASGKTIEFPGYLRAYVEGSDDPESELADQERILPPLSEGEVLNINKMEALAHETQPPARYTEGSLIKELERLGIGRPSTWATIVDVVLSRDYAFKKGTALVPTFLATALASMLEKNFTQIMQYEFTAKLEDDLDAISRGEAENLEYLRRFYFGNGHPGLLPLVEKGEKEIDPREVNGIPVGTDPETGKVIELRVGRYGPFFTDGENKASVPENTAPDEVTYEMAQRLIEEAKKGPESIGNDPDSGLPVYLKSGRFGPYVQLGESQQETGEKPKMASLLPGMVPADVTLDIATQLLTLPKVIGKNPENSEDIIVSNGRYGPYIKCGTDNRTIPLDEFSPLTLTLEQAVILFSRPKTRGRQGAVQPKSMKDLGVHPDTNAKVEVKSGRYGPYVTDGNVNASVPKGIEVEDLTLEQALNLLAERAAKVGNKPKRGSRKAASPKKAAAPKKTAAPKKSAAPKKAATEKKVAAPKKSAGATGKSAKGKKAEPVSADPGEDLPNA